MSYQNAEEVDSVFQAIANWIQRYREAIGLRAELAKRSSTKRGEIFGRFV